MVQIEGALKASPPIFGYVCTIILCHAICYLILHKIRLRVLNRVAMILFGVVFGILGNYYSYFKEQSDNLVHMNPRVLLDIIYPFYIFRITMGCENYTVMRALWQILLIGIVGYLIASVMLGLLVTSALFNTNFQYSLAIIYGLVLNQSFTYEVVVILSERVDVKTVNVLLETEGLMTNMVCLILFQVILGHYFGFVQKWFQILSVFLRLTIGGLIAGVIMSYVSVMLIKGSIHDPAQLMLVILLCMLSSYGFPEMLALQGIVSCAFVGVVLGMYRTMFRTRVDRFIQVFSLAPTYIIQNVGAFTLGVLLAQDISINITIRMVLLVFVVYFILYLLRLLVLFLLSPVLSRIGFGLTLKECLVLVWGSTRGLYSFIFALMLIRENEENLNIIGQHLLFVSTGVMMLSMVINATTFSAILRMFGIGEISTSRKNNMASCLKRLEYKRTRCITTLKYDRFLSDVKWPLVSEATTLKHPYKGRTSVENDDNDLFLVNRILVCPSCHNDVPSEPTRKEMNEMIREAHRRILKGQSVSFARQHENGLLSKLGFRILKNTIETALETKDNMVELNDLLQMLHIKTSHTFARIIMKYSKIVTRKAEKRHRYKCRLVCHMIMNHWAFWLFITLVITVNCVLAIINLTQSDNRDLFWSSTYCNMAFYIIYLIEFFIKVFGLAYTTFLEGLQNYFKNMWNVFDFVILLSCTADVTLAIYVLVHHKEQPNFLWKLMTIMKFIQLMRILRMIELFKLLIWKLTHLMSERSDKRLMLSYEIGKAYVTSLEEVQEMLQQMIDNEKVRETCRLDIERDRLMITRQLGLIQKDRPWITITVKTKQAIIATLNSIKNVINEIKVSGWVDDIEHRKLTDSLYEQFRLVNNLKAVQPSTPREMIKEIPWMAGEDILAEILFEKVIPKTFEAGEIICAEGTIAPGVFVIIQGLIQLSYKPSGTVFENLDNYGALPIVDYMISTRFNEKYEEYFGSGNTFGEISVLTHRPYNCSVYAETLVQSYLLTNDVLQHAFEESSDPIEGLKAKMWKMIATRLATTILLELPNYSSKITASIRYILDRSFVPDLSHFKVFSVTESIEDLILIEGIVMDYNTREIYLAPTYIPRTVQKLVLPTDERMNFQTKLETKILILPSKDIEESDLMELIENASEINRTDSFLQLAKERRKRKRRQRRTTFIVNKRHTEALNVKKSKSSGHSDESSGSEEVSVRSNYTTVTAAK
ncbi:sodium/hydrogen exchanger 10-like isoform X2 [Agrilus planipennis]|uniref:Sodium/hydrogen exchanger 10-like isoform X2 n=1 Tax=Agrilus planipennis TaxID=224129 RepID=A0A7F5RJU2_AGRPL|nr:sodium/hydrogen exchanger 10-like isoform X2 [Agrilus planipennis]